MDASRCIMRSWQNAVIPAGKYSFWVQDNFSLLRLSEVGDPAAGYLLIVPIKEESKSSDTNKILLETSAAGSYVSAMHLPQLGLILRFDVPHMRDKQMAKAESTLTGSGQ